MVLKNPPAFESWELLSVFPNGEFKQPSPQFIDFCEPHSKVQTPFCVYHRRSSGQVIPSGSGNVEHANAEEVLDASTSPWL